MRKFLLKLLPTLALTVLFIICCLVSDARNPAMILVLPFSLAGNALRSLSLSGTAGNIVSIVLYVLICLLPLIPCIRGKRKTEDLLLLLCSGMMFYTVYSMINPSVRSVAMQSATGDLILCGAVYSILLSYVMIRLLRRCTEAKSDSIYRILRFFVLAGIVISSFATASGFADFLTAVKEVSAANTMPGIDLMPTYVFLFLSFALTLSENTLITLILFLADELLCELASDPYGDGCCDVCEKIFAWCRKTIVIISIANVVFTVAQILLSSELLAVSVQFRLPLAGLAVAFAFLALSRLLNKGRKIKHTNDLFI